MGRNTNVEVFEDTEKMCREHARLVEGVKKSRAGQKLILEKEPFPAPKLNIYEEKARVVVSKKRSLEAARAYKGTKTAVHNFASAKNPGGGVVNGASAQEECLCRCSDLYFCLNTSEMMEGFYLPHRAMSSMLYNGDVIYTPDIIVFKSDDASPRTMPEKDWYEVDIITCAAPNLRHGIRGGNTDLRTIHETRLRRMLDIAVTKGVESIVLGAFGCGAFMNDPAIVADASKRVLKDYLYAFKNIEYAVYCSPKNDANYQAFHRALAEYCG